MAVSSLIQSRRISKAQRQILDNYFAQGLRVSDYQMVAGNGRPIRKASRVTFPDGSEVSASERMGKYAAALWALEHQGEAKRPFLTCRSCGQSVLPTPAGATAQTNFTCRNCTPKPASGPTFQTFRDDAATRELMARYEADRDSMAGMDDLEAN